MGLDGRSRLLEAVVRLWPTKVGEGCRHPKGGPVFDKDKAAMRVRVSPHDFQNEFS